MKFQALIRTLSIDTRVSVYLNSFAIIHSSSDTYFYFSSRDPIFRIYLKSEAALVYSLINPKFTNIYDLHYRHVGKGGLVLN